MNDERRGKVGLLSESPRKEHLERAWGATPFTVICLPPRGLISKADFQELVPFPITTTAHTFAMAWPRPGPRSYMASPRRAELTPRVICFRTQAPRPQVVSAILEPVILALSSLSSANHSVHTFTCEIMSTAARELASCARLRAALCVWRRRVHIGSSSSW